MDVIKVSRPALAGDLIAWLVDFNFCRERVTFAANAAAALSIPQFSLIGVQFQGAQNVVQSAKAGNVGDGAMNGLVVAAGALAGKWIIKFDNAGAAAQFTVRNPNGVEDGEGAVGQAYVGSGAIEFTIADDAAKHYAQDDELYVTVSYVAGAGNWAVVNPNAVDGTQYAAGIVLGEIDAPQNATAQGGILARGPGLIRSAPLVFPAGSTAAQQAAWLAQLAGGSQAVLQGTAGAYGQGGILARASG